MTENDVPNLLVPLSLARRVLSSLPAGLITDVDGTISRIVARPEMAGVEPRILGVLHRLVLRLDLVAAISGRSIPQLLSMLEVEGMVYVGNHGLEWWEGGRASVVPEAQPFLSSIADTMQALRALLDIPGVVLEEKGATGSAHYRLSDDPSGTHQAILRAIGACPSARGLRVAEGRMVVNLLPPVRVDKGTAVARLVRSRGLRGVVYLGDDVTDLDAYRELLSLRDSGICDALLLAVASPEAPTDLTERADYLLDGVDAVASFLEQVAERLDRRSETESR